jgi:DNA repair exonuclease SbcCD nuclease subunit
MNEVVEYIGSPLELNFGEAHTEKHIIVLDTDTLDVDYVVNDFSPKHLIIRESEIDQYQLDGNFVQIIVDDIASTDIIDLKKTVLKDKGIATLEFKERTKKKKVDDENEDEPAHVAMIKDMANGNIFEKWAKAQGHPNLDLEKLLSIAQEITGRV